MVKDDLIKKVHDFHGALNYKESLEVVDRFFEILAGALKKGESIKLTGLGVLKRTKTKTKKITHPKTGETLILDERFAITFKPSKMRFGNNGNDQGCY